MESQQDHSMLPSKQKEKSSSHESRTSLEPFVFQPHIPVDASRLSTHHIQTLQQTIGNRAAMGLIQGRSQTAGNSEGSTIQRMLEKAQKLQKVKVWLENEQKIINGRVAESYNFSKSNEEEEAIVTIQLENKRKQIQVDCKHVYSSDMDDEDIYKSEGIKIQDPNHDLYALLAQKLGKEEEEFISLVLNDINLKQYIDGDSEYLKDVLEGNTESEEEESEILKDLIVMVDDAERNEESLKAIGTGKSSSRDWAFTRIRFEASKLARNSNTGIFPGGKYSLHHKISQNHLDTLHGQMEQDGDQAEPVRTVLKEIAAYIGTGSTNYNKILHNMPAGLEAGPPSDQRIGDPGSSFDGNVPDSPRTVRLRKVDDAITHSPNHIPWQEVAQNLAEAHKIHKKLTGDKLLSDPKSKQWKQMRDGKFERGNWEED
ncbi:hypothetical protein [Paenibacillus turpanensis]|uniref:hypothetical protein n=1 Tax=Paenibacillus turpanensis TaxID=2689078 RepID=UPI001A9E5580|nr:hypothetical protein [Paenibacillus turpanensis]